MKAYAMCPSCNFVHEQSSLQSCNRRRRAKVACSAQPCPTVLAGRHSSRPKAIHSLNSSFYLVDTSLEVVFKRDKFQN
jgi:hypothetical protein